MIFDLAIEQQQTNKNKTKKSISIVQQTANSKKFVILTPEQIKAFVDDQQIIHCVHYMSEDVSYQKLIKIYFLLFQISMKYSNKQSMYNFLCRHQFYKKLMESKIQNSSKPTQIIAGKISKFLDSFKIKQCPKTQINSLISEYHQFRLLQNTKQTFVLHSCALIKEYIFYHLNELIAELQEVHWTQMNNTQFTSFYQHYSEICTICKRASYIKCQFFAFPVFEVPVSIRNKIEERFANLNQKQNTKIEVPCDQQQPVKPIVPIVSPVISVKKKLKAMNSLIAKMQQNI